MDMSRFRQKGFTAIELMIVLVVSAILLTLTIPSFQNVIRRSVLTTGANSMSTAMSLARAKAIMARRNVRMCPSIDLSTCESEGSWAGGWIMFLDDNGNGAPSSSELLQARSALDSWITLKAPDAFTQWLEFKPTGIVQGNSGTSGQFTFCSGDYDTYSRRVNIGASGRVTTNKNTQADLCI